MAYHARSLADRKLTLQVTGREHLTLIGTYTLNGVYLSTYQSPDAAYKWLREGTVLAYDAAADMVYPKTATGDTAGVLEDRVMVPVQVATPPYHPAVAVFLQGWLRSQVITDNGIFGTPTADTIADLAGRIRFVPGDKV